MGRVPIVATQPLRYEDSRPQDHNSGVNQSGEHGETLGENRPSAWAIAPCVPVNCRTGRLVATPAGGP